MYIYNYKYKYLCYFIKIIKKLNSQELFLSIQLRNIYIKNCIYISIILLSNGI